MNELNLISKPRLDHDNWYRIEEREKQPVKLDKSLIGQMFIVKQYIVRAGYLVSPMDFEYHVVHNKAIEMLAAKIRSSSWDKITYEMAKQVAYDLKEAYGERVLPIYQARGRLMHDATSDHPMRTLWYATVPGNYVLLTGSKRCNVGEYYAPESGYYSGEYDYDPGGLKGMKVHMIYTARMMQSDYTVQSNLKPHLFEIYGFDALIHPSDLLPVGSLNEPASGW